VTPSDGLWYRIRDHNDEVFWRNESLGVSIAKPPVGSRTTGDYRVKEAGWFENLKELSVVLAMTQDLPPFDPPPRENDLCVLPGYWALCGDGQWRIEDEVGDSGSRFRIPQLHARTRTGWRRIENAAGHAFWYHDELRRAAASLNREQAGAAPDEDGGEDKAAFLPIGVPDTATRAAGGHISDYILYLTKSLLPSSDKQYEVLALKKKAHDLLVHEAAQARTLPSPPVVPLPTNFMPPETAATSADHQAFEASVHEADEAPPPAENAPIDEGSRDSLERVNPVVDSIFDSLWFGNPLFAPRSTAPPVAAHPRQESLRRPPKLPDLQTYPHLPMPPSDEFHFENPMTRM
jgi:hypothetical protein